MEPSSDRVHLIDALRGIALFGVVVMNLTAMVMAFVAADVMAAATPPDVAFAIFDLVLLQGKARCMFALLFGVGFGLLLSRAKTQNPNFAGFFMRRAVGLLLIGIFNLVFLYWGDILILYALLGMSLLFFRSWSDGSILKLGLTLIVAPPILLGIIEWITGVPLPSFGNYSPEKREQIRLLFLQDYRSNDFVAFMSANVSFYLDQYYSDTGPMMVYSIGVLGLFLLGYWIERQGILYNVENWRSILHRIAWICIPVGLVISAIHASRQIGVVLDGATYALVSASYVGLPIMAFGYAAFLALFLTRRGKLIQRLLAPVGRMALTGYLASNLIGAFVFYGWGLGLLGDWSLATINLFAFTVFGSLAFFSAVWLKAFRFGPVEWMWRSMTYAKFQPMKAAAVDVLPATP